MYDLIGNIKVPVIMCDCNDSFAVSFHQRQEFAVKELAEYNILIGSPLVKDIDVFVIEIAKKQRNALALSAGRQCRIVEERPAYPSVATYDRNLKSPFPQHSSVSRLFRQLQQIISILD